MKKTATFLFVILLSFCMVLFASATDTVYLDGTGATADAYTDFATAFGALENGGTLIVCGDTTFGTSGTGGGVTLPAVGGKVTITGANDATLTMARSLTLSSEVEFNNINFCAAHDTNGNIIANGNPITFGENVNVTVSADRYPTIIGGSSSGTLTSDSHITVKSGTFLAVYGGNFAGTFNGNSVVDLLGGTVTSAVAGGNLNGNFKGNATVNIGGDATVEYYSSTNIGIAGGTIGSSSSTATAYTFEGDIAINYFGNATINGNTYGVSRYSNITTTGNLTLTVSENAQINRQTYAGGYFGNTAEGSSSKIIFKDNAKVNGSKFVCAGAYSGSFMGDCSVEIYDNASITGAVFAGCYNGDVTGNASLLMNGGTVTSTFSSTSRTGSVSGTQSILLKNGTVGGEVKGDAAVDLAAGASVTIKSCSGTVTTTVPDGYELSTVVGDTSTTYTAIPKEIPTIVYLDGTGATEGAYADLSAAAAALQNGGDIIVAGDTDITAATVLPEGVTLNITAENGAVLNLGARLTLGGETTFDNITINNASTSQQFIVANGNPIIFGAGVATTTDGTELAYPVIVGGNYSTACTTGSHVTVKGGTWRNIYGANYNGTFTGDSTVDFTGGTVLVTLSGGSYSGDYEGNATLNIGGTATVEYNTVSGVAIGVIGGNVGVDNGTARTFNGTININIGGDAVINSLIIGTARQNNITTTADVNIDIFGNADINRNIYGGGWLGNTTTENGITVTLRENSSFSHPTGSVYICAGSQEGTVTGNVKTVVKDNANIAGNIYGGGFGGSVVGSSTAEIYGGAVTVNFTAGSRSGNVSGDTVVNAYGGEIGYDAAYGISGNGGTGGTVSGTAYITLDGASVSGAIEAGTENYNITLRSGDVSSVSDTVRIDVSGTKTLTVGGDVVASDFVGGGSITLSADGSIVTDKMSGEVTLLIEGTPVHKHTYITVNDIATEATVNYTPADTDVLEKVVGDTVTYTLRYTDRYDSTHVKVYYYNPLGTDQTQPNIVMVKGLSTEDDRVSVELTKSTEDGRGVAEADLTTGLHYYKVYYNGSSDYEIKYFYVSGKAESLTFECELEPLVANSYMEGTFSNQTDEVMAYFGTDGLVGYTEPETFAYHMDERAFLTNADVCDYVATLDERSEYLHVFYPFETSAMGNEWPVMVFTKDTVADGATFDEAAAAIRSAGEREILMITAGVHGNEPAGPEGALFLASELCGEYGNEVLDHFGAIVMMPVVSIDNSQRFKRMTADGINPNRDLMALYLPSSQHQIYVYKSFMPTITIDCHEDNGSVEVDASDYSIENMDDVCIRYSGLQNSPLHSVSALADGTESVLDQKGINIMLDAIERTRDSGVRSSIYYSATANPVTSTDYPSTRGSYGFIVETMRIWSGKGRYERAVFAMKEALKSLIAEFIEEDGALAASVYENRARVAAITDFDENNLFARKTSLSGNVKVTMPRPSIYVDGTYKDANGTKDFKLFDSVSNLRALPTAYVVPADAENIDNVIALLNMHGISYTKLRAGSTLTLRAYEGIDTALTSSAAVTLADAAEVTFENGAYIVTMNTSDAYLVAYLFEPDSFSFTSAENTTISMTHMGYITDGTLYRSEVDDMPAVIADMVYIEGDINNDGKVDIADVMQALRACLNEDGSLLDVLRILKLTVK